MFRLCGYLKVFVLCATPLLLVIILSQAVESIRATTWIKAVSRSYFLNCLSCSGIPLVFDRMRITL